MRRRLARIPRRKVVVVTTVVVALLAGLATAWLGMGGTFGAGAFERWLSAGGAFERPGLGHLSLALLLAAVLTPVASRLQAHERIRLPRTVGGRELSRDRGLRVRMAVVLVVSLALPAVLVVAPLVLLDSYGWAVADVVVLVTAIGAGAGMLMHEKASHVESTPADVSATLQRLCLRADVPIPPLVHHDTADATAWAEDGRIHVTAGLIERLTPGELEAVLAHELTHLARGDALVMDVVTAPSRHLLAGVRACFISILEDVRVGLVGIVVGTVLLVPALVLAAINRLLAAALSRGRELSADATAAVLTGNPAALASALGKLDESVAPPSEDLRGRATLRIVALRRSRLPFLRTHPATAERVARLQAMEARLQA